MSFRRLALAAALVAAAPAAFAATDSKTMNVSVTVTNVCTLTADALAFGNADLSGNADAQADIKVNCSNKGAYSMTFGAGNNASGAQRRMKHATLADTLNYDLYSDSGRATALSNSSFAGTSTGGNVDNVHTVFGRVPTGQSNKATGTYNDAVLVTLTY